MSEHTSILLQAQTASAAIVKDAMPVQERMKNIYDECLQHLPIQRKLSIDAVDDPLEKEADNMADKVMRMPEQNFIQRKCAHCEEEEKAQRRPLLPFIQKKSEVNNNKTSDAISSQIQSTKDSGNKMPENTKTFMESRFGADFSNVNIHTGNYASQLSNDLNAQAFTAGNNIYFNEGKYQPESDAGKHLLAHELTHTIQQRGSIHSTYTVQKADDNALDEPAKKIINAGKDASNPIDKRAIDAVNSIIKTYYDPAMVSEVVYDEKEDGLVTSPDGTGKDIKGKITVGKYFIDHIGSFGRRVLQVGHELQHVQQQRSGMGGPAKRNEREFNAFNWEATQPEKSGTGRMPHSSRVALIDEALRNYYCMPVNDQKTHTTEKDDLLKLRATEEKASGNAHVDAPTSCPSAKTEKASKADQKTQVTSPGGQTVKTDEGIQFAVKTGVETETKTEKDKSNTEGTGKISFEMTIPVTDKLKLGPFSFLKEGGVEGSFNRKLFGGESEDSLELEVSVKLISLDWEKVKVPLGFADFGISASMLADEEYSLTKKTPTEKLGFAAEGEAKFRPGTQKRFYITATGGMEKTYDKEGKAEFKSTPLKWKTSLGVGFEF